MQADEEEAESVAGENQHGAHQPDNMWFKAEYAELRSQLHQAEQEENRSLPWMSWKVDVKEKLATLENKLDAVEQQLGYDRRVDLDSLEFQECTQALAHVRLLALEQQITAAVYDLSNTRALQLRILGRRKETKHLMLMCNKLQQRIRTKVEDWNRWRRLQADAASTSADGATMPSTRPPQLQV